LELTLVEREEFVDKLLNIRVLDVAYVDFFHQSGTDFLLIDFHVVGAKKLLPRNFRIVADIPVLNEFLRHFHRCRAETRELVKEFRLLREDPVLKLGVERLNLSGHPFELNLVFSKGRFSVVHVVQVGEQLCVELSIDREDNLEFPQFVDALLVGVCVEKDLLQGHELLVLSCAANLVKKSNQRVDVSCGLVLGSRGIAVAVGGVVRSLIVVARRWVVVVARRGVVVVARRRVAVVRSLEVLLHLNATRASQARRRILLIVV